MKNKTMKKWLAFLLILNFVLLTCASHGSMEVKAATFTPRLSAPSSSDKYWIHTSAGGLNECIKVNGNSVLPNCVGYAWGRAYEILGSRPNLAKTDAKTWYTSNISSGAYSYGSTPKLGAIACWAYTSSSAGHVAVVEKIEGSKVTISESHYGGGRFNTKVINADGSGYLSNFQGYIYIGDFEQTNSPVGAVDAINTSYNTVTVSGWALDMDDVKRSVTIHVYVGDYLAGTGIANEYRPDINQVYAGAGEYHAFNITCTVPPEYTGTQTVTVYAIDAETGINPSVGANVNSTVNIPLSNEPTGSVDKVSTGYSMVAVTGWALDMDDMKRSVEVQVYIGEKCIGNGIANKYRQDIADVYQGAGEYHAFHIECAVSSEYTGTQTVTVYAIDGETGTKSVIGSNVNLTVNIPLDSEKPVISDVIVKDIDETGYTVQCTVTDNTGVNRVQFPTWTNPEQDDIQSDWGNNTSASGIKNGNTYTYRVNISDHNNEKTRYMTHIYAFDNYGNTGVTSIAKHGYEEISVQYTITYNANGGSGTPTAQKKDYGKTLTLSSTIPTRSNYNFKGWATSSSATSAEYQAGGSYTKNASTTLYAVWQHVCANGHNYAYKLATAPTVSATGKINGVCSRCNATTTVALPKLNTDDYTYKVVKDETCTVDGTGRYTWKTTSYGNYYFDTVIAPIGHSYNVEVTEPSCAEGGYTTHKCSLCGDSYVDGEIEALGHRLGEWEITKDTTCTETGEAKRACERCGYFETKQLEATGHNYVNSVCTVCGSKDPNASQEVCEVFADVLHDTWYEEAVQYVYDNGIMSGSAGLFSPNNSVTRSMVVETLYKMEGKPAVSDFAIYDQYTDLDRYQWWANSVSWAMNLGIATGDNYYMKFNPETAVTREQLATFLYRYAKYKNLDVTLSKDASAILGDAYVNSYARDAFAWAVDIGLISGVESNGVKDLNSQGVASRAQMAAIMQRLANHYKDI